MSTTELPFPLPSLSFDHLFAAAQRQFCEDTLLPAYIPNCRWFSGKARDPRKFRILDAIPVSPAPDAARLVVVEATYADKSTEMYLLPLQLLSGQAANELSASRPQAVLARSADSVLCDAIYDEAFRSALFTLMASGNEHSGERGSIVGQPGPALEQVTGIPDSRALAVEQSNSSIVYGEHIFLKLYRRLEYGMNPDAEILRFLSEQGFLHAPPFAGAIEYRDADGRGCVLALATGLVTNNGDAWSFTLGELKRWFGALLAGDTAKAGQIESELLARAAQLGTRTGQMHLALARKTADPEFSAEPLMPEDSEVLAKSILDSTRQIRSLIHVKLDSLPEPARSLAGRFRELEPAVHLRIESLAAGIFGIKTRTHGDYHLGQVLETGGDFVIIDFEGEPLRSLATRREKRSPLRDVAGMLRSFDYAAHASMENQPEQRSALSAKAEQWSAKAQKAFLHGWRAATQGANFRAATLEEENRLLEAFLLEKALYEVVYEINNRPTWLPIPLRGVLRLLEGAALS